MDPVFLGAMVALGLASGVHCAGMCGGIVTAFSVKNRGQSPISARLIVFNAGRISSYAIAGALAGTLGWYAGGPQTALLVLANFVLVFVGLHLAGVRSCFGAGCPAGWFTELTAAAFAGSPAAGAAAMLAFGIGTLPWLLAAGVAAARVRDYLRMSIVRLTVGGTVLAFGAWGLAHAGTTFICS